MAARGARAAAEHGVGGLLLSTQLDDRQVGAIRQGLKEAVYIEGRRSLALQKDAPLYRTVQPAGVIVAIPILPGLHHQYVRIRFSERTRHGRNGWHGLLIARSIIENKEGPGTLGPF